ncbi:MAG: KilA-N domain-containing protein [Candidatus Nanoarchaeia archaeon]
MVNLNVLDRNIGVYVYDKEDYICLTDIAKFKGSANSDDVIKNWLRNRNTIEFLGLWESINNAEFKPVEFDGFRKQAGLNSFVLTAKQWIEKTNAKGIISRQGRGGGTYAHKDIAFEFASWVSIEFKLYLIKEFQRLKAEENERKQLGWDIKRNLAKINYRIHTDAVRKHLIPEKVSRTEEKLIYATEADLLNLALFGLTAKEWKESNPGKEGNMRDYADVTQLVCLSNLENLNALFIKEGLTKANRLEKLNSIAIEQMTILSKISMKKLDFKSKFKKERLNVEEKSN